MPCARIQQSQQTTYMIAHRADPGIAPQKVLDGASMPITTSQTTQQPSPRRSVFITATIMHGRCNGYCATGCNMCAPPSGDFGISVDPAAGDVLCPASLLSHTATKDESAVVSTWGSAIDAISGRDIRCGTAHSDGATTSPASVPVSLFQKRVEATPLTGK